MTLGELIATLEAADPDMTVPQGIGKPHSYRGYYDELAFEPVRNVTVRQMLADARSAVGATYDGWKGGEYTMTEDTGCWLAVEGSTGESIGPVLLLYMLAAAKAAPVADTVSAAPVSPDLSCTRCDGEPAKVIIVERDGHPARLFAASNWEVVTTGVETGDLLLRDADDTIAQLGARTWDSVCDAEAILPADLYARQGKKLAIALDALRLITGDACENDTAVTLRILANEGLDAVAELDL